MSYKERLDMFRRSPRYRRDLRYFAILYIITLLAVVVIALLSVRSLVGIGVVPQADEFPAVLTSVALWCLVVTGGHALVLVVFHLVGMEVARRGRAQKAEGSGAGS